MHRIHVFLKNDVALFQMHYPDLVQTLRELLSLNQACASKICFGFSTGEKFYICPCYGDNTKCVLCVHSF